MKGNVIQMNTLHLNSVRLNGIGKVQSVSLKGGSTEDPVFPPVEPPVEPEPTYTLSASVTNGKVSAKRNGSAVNLPFTANEGDVIVVEVTPNDGYTFEGWNDGNTDNPRTITMTADVVLSAQCVEVVVPPVGNYIQFEDKAVEAICVANWSSDGIGLTEEDAAAVTSIGTTFRGNTEITSFDEFRYFTGVTFLSTTTSTNTGAFEGCSALESICLPSSVTTIGDYSFSQCSALKVVGGMDNVATIMRYAFNESGMEELNLPSCTIMRTSIAPNSQIKRIIAPSLQKILGSLIKVYNLELLDVGAELNEIEAYSFWQMTTGKITFICRATTPPTLGGNNNMTFCSAIYVPDASVEAYKTATNWNTYADRIHPLSEIEGNALGLVSDGNAYIVTDYYPNTYDNVEVEFESPSSTTLQLLLGSRESLSNKNLFVSAINPSSGGGGYVDRFYLNTTPPNIVANGRNNIKLQLSSNSEGKLMVDLFMRNDMLVNTYNRSTEPTEYEMPYPLVVFGANQMNNSAIDTRIFKGTIYFVKITDARSGEVKLYLQPRVVDGVAGMMDTISGTFYTNSNTKGTFSVE